MDIIDSLRECVGDGKLLTLQPGGNHGDTLIYLGMRKLLRESGIDWVPLSENEIRVDQPRQFDWRSPNQIVPGLRDRLMYLRHRLNRNVDAVYIHGGGNFNDLWGGGIRCFATAVRFFDCPIIVGPQSYVFDSTDPETIFSGVSNPIRLYCREGYSFELLAPVVDRYPNVEIGLSEDTALALSRADLPLSTYSEEYTLLAFRSDAESTTPTIEEQIEPPIVVRDVSTDEPSFEGFVDAVARSSRIFTDRLHVAILAALLDKQATFYDNSYHKNRGVYEYSLSRYPTVTFRYLR